MDETGVPTVDEAIREARQAASADWRRADEVEDDYPEWANQLRGSVRRQMEIVDRMERDPGFAAEQMQAWYPDTNGEPAVKASTRTAPEIHTGATSTGHAFASGYGNLTAKRLAHALGYRLTPPRPLGASAPATRPREQRPTHRPRARAPGGDDDPSPLNRALQPALELDARALRVLVSILLIRLRLRRKRGER